jgi:hypothetical protein
LVCSPPSVCLLDQSLPLPEPALLHGLIRPSTHLPPAHCIAILTASLTPALRRQLPLIPLVWPPRCSDLRCDPPPRAAAPPSVPPRPRFSFDRQMPPRPAGRLYPRICLPLAVDASLCYRTAPGAPCMCFILDPSIGSFRAASARLPHPSLHLSVPRPPCTRAGHPLFCLPIMFALHPFEAPLIVTLPTPLPAIPPAPPVSPCPTARPCTAAN